MHHLIRCNEKKSDHFCDILAKNVWPESESGHNKEGKEEKKKKTQLRGIQLKSGLSSKVLRSWKSKKDCF